MLLATGKYTGTGLGASITGCGFTPLMVWVQSMSATEVHTWRTDKMPATNSIDCNTSTTHTTGIVSLDADGFTVGTLAQVHADGEVHHWAAFASDPIVVDFVTGSYAGDGQDNRDITSVGLDPIFVGIQRPSYLDMCGSSTAIQALGADDTRSKLWGGGVGSSANFIQSLGTDKFQVGSNANVNHIDEGIYYYYAIGSTVGSTEVGSYQGNGTGRTITLADATITPKIILVHGHNVNVHGGWRVDTMDDTNWVVPDANGIAGSIETTGVLREGAGSFDLGTGANVNFASGTPDYAYLVIAHLAGGGGAGGPKGQDYSYRWGW
jgi:hypothetical protein